jgi:serine/threonine protein kinase/beta-lactam-binding protein with PASTA domain
LREQIAASDREIFVTEGVAHSVRLLAGRYQVGDLIGRGGMADVHVGTDSRLGRRVAIKLLKPALATDPAFRSRFRREAQDAAKMAHPTIVRIFDAGEETTTDERGADIQVPFIIMEFVDGRLLKDIIAAGPLDPAEAMRITGQVLTALEYSHRAGVVHRDIKPGNIMVTTSGQVKVMDFGIARAISESSATIAETSTIVGTAQYFSPEQARGEAVDARTDLYSMGIVLFEMLTGQAPFVGDNPVAVAYQHVNQQALRPSTINPAVTPAIDAVVLRAMAKDRFERYQSAAEFRTESEGAMAGALVGASVGAPRRAPAAPDFNSTLFGVNPTSTTGSEATLRQLTAEETDRSIRTQSRPPVAWIWGGIAILTVVVLAVGFWFVTFANSQGSFNPGVSVAVTEVTGFSWDSGAASLTDQGLTPTRIDKVDPDVAAGVIISTEPAAGETVAPGSGVKVYVSSGGAKVKVPDLSGLSQKDARAALEKLGITLGITSSEDSATVKKGTVISASIPANEFVTPGETTVDLVVSTGKINVPDVIGDPIGDATKLLNGSEYGLQVKIEANEGCSGGKVSAQSIKGKQDQRSPITLTYCSGS